MSILSSISNAFRRHSARRVNVYVRVDSVISDTIDTTKLASDILAGLTGSDPHNLEMHIDIIKESIIREGEG